MGLKTMLYRNTVWHLAVDRSLLQKHLKGCKVCQEQRVCKRYTKMGTLNDSVRPGEVLGINYVGPMDKKYMLVKMDFFSRMVKLDLCCKLCICCQHIARD